MDDAQKEEKMPWREQGRQSQYSHCPFPSESAQREALSLWEKESEINTLHHGYQSSGPPPAALDSSQWVPRSTSPQPIPMPSWPLAPDPNFKPTLAGQSPRLSLQANILLSSNLRLQAGSKLQACLSVWSPHMAPAFRSTPMKSGSQDCASSRPTPTD